jgi:hypothetical protein
MQVKTFEINGNNVVDAAGKVDWNFVKDTPQISITDNNHSHATRYYTKTEVDSRISSLNDALNQLQIKVNNIK